MPYRFTIQGVPRQPARADRDSWALVQRLMDAGWYRLGQDRDPRATAWGFRAGHTTTPWSPRGYRIAKPAAGPGERWLVAKHEQTAMRRLLRDLGVGTGVGVEHTPPGGEG